MTRNFRHTQILNQPTSLYPIELDNSYVKLRIEQAQFFYEAEEILSRLVQPSSVALLSSVEVTSEPGANPVKFSNVHNFGGVKRDQPSQLSLNIDLTDWIPAWKTAKIYFELQFVVIRDNKFEKLYKEMSSKQLAGKAGMISKELGVGIGASQLTAQLLSYLLQENMADEPLSAIRETIELSELRPGYLAFLGSIKNKNLPSQVRLNDNGQISNSSNFQFDQCSYFLMKAISINRLGTVVSKNSKWWQLLDYCRNQIKLGADSSLSPEQKERWFFGMAVLAKQWANEDKRLLVNEIDDILRVFYGDVEKILYPERPHSYDSYSALIKNIVHVDNRNELELAIKDYEAGLELAQTLRKEYREE